MNRRCTKKTSARNDKSYLSKGIEVCARWKKFDYFFIDMWGSYVSHQSHDSTELDRIDNDKGYNNKNCRWVTRTENMNNTGNVKKIRGKTLTQWAKILKVKRVALVQRRDKGWSDEDIIRPFRKYSS